MKLKLKLNHWFPKYFLKPFGFEAITLFPYVLIASSTTSIYLARHEFEHGKQIKELGLFTFYFLYIKYFILNFIKYKNWFEAYYHIAFEVEARKSQHRIYDQDFLEWLEYTVKYEIEGMELVG